MNKQLKKIIKTVIPKDALDYAIASHSFHHTYALKKKNKKILDLVKKNNHQINLGLFMNECDKESITLKELSFVAGGSYILDYAFIYEIARRFSCTTYLEIGTWIGESINILTDLCEELHSVTAGDDSPFSPKRSSKVLNIPDYSEASGMMVGTMPVL